MTPLTTFLVIDAIGFIVYSLSRQIKACVFPVIFGEFGSSPQSPALSTFGRPRQTGRERQQSLDLAIQTLAREGGGCRNKKGLNRRC